MTQDIQRRDGADSLNWTGYVYGGLAHSAHLRYAEESEATGEASVRRGLARMGLRPEDVAGRRVLDVGTGLYGLGFRRLGAVVEHHDISTRSVNALNAYALGRGDTGLQSFRTDLVKDLLPTEHFDLVYLSGIFQHFAVPARALSNVARALKVGGHLYIDIYRSGRWRWFVVDLLRKIVDRSLLYDVLSRFTETCALGETRAFHLRQVELLVDDLFVESVHLFRPDDVAADARALGLTQTAPATSMNLVDADAGVDHSLFFAHVFSTQVFRKSEPTGAAITPTRTSVGRCQLAELDAMSDACRAVADLAAEFVLAHRSGRFSRAATVSHVVNLFRMAHPCFTADPYMVAGRREPVGAEAVAGDEQTLKRRAALFCTYVSNVLNVKNPLEPFKLESLGYELVRFLAPTL